MNCSTSDAQHIHHVHKGDIRVPLSVCLKPRKSSTPIDLTGLDVDFYMVDTDGNTKVAQSNTGVGNSGDATGVVSKTFLEADVDTPGDYYAYFVVDFSGAEETIPPETGGLIVRVHDD